jgi:toxin ParE1/3/4
LGRARPELCQDIRSTPFKNYLIFFRYLPTEADREILEVVNVIESHRDLLAYFADDD